jgi:hypothetical protein
MRGLVKKEKGWKKCSFTPKSNGGEDQSKEGQILVEEFFQLLQSILVHAPWSLM